MNVVETDLRNVLIVEPEIHGDSRGFFLESFHEARYEKHGIPMDSSRFVQDNHSRSTYGVLRGLHFQLKHPQGKLIRVTRGSVYDVAVDVNPESTTFCQWVGVELNEENHRQFWIPPGYAHGFCVLSEVVDFQYKCTGFYHPEFEGGVRWNDNSLAIEWPLESPVLSHKDANLPLVRDMPRNLLP